MTNYVIMSDWHFTLSSSQYQMNAVHHIVNREITIACCISVIKRANVSILINYSELNFDVNFTLREIDV